MHVLGSEALGPMSCGNLEVLGVASLGWAGISLRLKLFFEIKIGDGVQDGFFSKIEFSFIGPVRLI